MDNKETASSLQIYEDLASRPTAMEEAAELSKQLLAAEEEMNKAEALYKEKKAAYDHFAMEVIPEFYKANGISSMSLDNGIKLSVEQKITCSPKKESKPALIQWLKSKGADDIIKEELSVNPVFLDRLRAQNIPCLAKGDVNTNSLKSWLAEQLGLRSGSIAKMSYEDIPDFVNYYRFNTTVVSK